ncbi:High frequency lysogenization protein HflD [Alcanivorax sp. ALC70]|uniref:high frequency lysogenization protein HflD n=1 Tax=Alloalcanivorax marinus TaxID=1177169 RepID=UPI00193403F2|nr:high frequency lysogenization protein HflD [Alloalcanivorax marinus]MBL7249968.1 high frequency lysogenization protein HflD [Alloalcanivorax marinus]UWN52194.1 High frequency lysogenization protein HflD [Alcanivorax sp. ALC70]
MNHEQQQMLALAAVFEAAVLADRIATGADTDPGAMEALFGGVMTMDTETATGVYPAPERLQDGMRLLRQSLSRQQPRESARPLSYALALLHLSAKLRKNSDVISILRHRLIALEGQRDHFDGLTSATFCHRLAGIYLDTLGTFRFRIRVQGDPAKLQDEDNAARIRALFLAGVRAAFLWHAHGGRRWRLLFQRKQQLEALNSIKNNNL